MTSPAELAKRLRGRTFYRGTGVRDPGFTPGETIRLVRGEAVARGDAAAESKAKGGTPFVLQAVLAVQRTATLGRQDFRDLLRDPGKGLGLRLEGFDSAVAEGDPDTVAVVDPDYMNVKFAQRLTDDAKFMPYSCLTEDMQVLIQQLVCDLDDTRPIPALLPMTEIRVEDLPHVRLDEYDRGSEHAREMDLAYTPPLLVADGHFMDGKHRTFVARERKVAVLPAIDLGECIDPELMVANSMGTIDGHAPAHAGPRI